MRRFAVAVMLVGFVQSAQAADMPDLPILRGSLIDGPRTYVNWEGFYVGGQVGYGAADMDFTGSNSAMTSRMLANTNIEAEMQVSQWPLFNGKSSQRQSTVGAFVGYNSQWDDIVLGVEASYMHGSFSGAATGSAALGATLSDGQYHIVNASSSASMQITDMGTIRGRVGYAYGSFLPYVFGGLALGNANINRFVQVSERRGATEADAIVATPITDNTSDSLHNHLLIGYSAGLGVDMMLFGNVFGRAEWEYARFTGAVDTNINTVRAGLGYRF